METEVESLMRLWGFIFPKQKEWPSYNANLEFAERIISERSK